MSNAICFDLHSHSTMSDGELPPRELVRQAAASGVQVLALTDHDVTDGVADAQDEAGLAGIRLVPGVEISVSWADHLVHIVGLGIDTSNSALQQGLSGLRDKRMQRAQAIAERLVKAGIDGAWDGALRYAAGQVVSRNHFARYLVECGRARDTQQAFKRYLSRGKQGYVAMHWATLEQAVGWITGAGGQAVIAHPARYRMSRTLLKALIEDFIAAGGVAIEVLSSSHSPAEARQIAALARQTGLLASSGSDFHGPGAPWARLGSLPPLSIECTPVWRDWDLMRDVTALAPPVSIRSA
ncbi:MAG: PHP domain-containing protein [Gammaproteobacteria bacterium]|nr:PHP domain-containing protein [Gammaproteobacteria bacterium]